MKGQQGISTLKNLGPVSAKWLLASGVSSVEVLRKSGAVKAYEQVVLHGFNPSLNLLYSLEAGLRDIHWTALPVNVKARLRKEVEWLGPRTHCSRKVTEMKPCLAIHSTFELLECVRNP